MASESLLAYAKDPETGQVIAKVVDEPHLDVGLDLLKGTHKVEVNVGAPKVAYRETLAKTAAVDYTHKKLSGGTGQLARVKLRLEPKEPGTGNAFVSEIIGGVVPKEYILGVEKGVQSVWDSGVLIGFPMIDMKVTLLDGSYHEIDSSPIAFQIAGRQAVREGCVKAGVKVLEPIMDVEVTTPGEFVNSIIGDLNNRRGQMCSQAARGSVAVFRAHVPFAMLFGYASGLRSITNGLGSYAFGFSHYAEIPRSDDPDDFRPAVGMKV
jgi:elongation factor G